MLLFDVSALLKAQIGQSLTLNLDTGPRKLEDLEVESLQVFIRVIRVQKAVFVEGTVEARLSLECVRCLEPLFYPLVLELGESFRLPKADPEPDKPYAVRSDGKLDLAPLIREQIWLDIPMKPLCDPNCKGLCPHCGINLNRESCTCEDEKIDPRLEALKELY